MRHLCRGMRDPRLGPGPLPSSAGAVRDLARDFAAARGEGCEREKPPGTSLRVRCNFWSFPAIQGSGRNILTGERLSPGERGGKGSPRAEGCEGVSLRGSGGAAARGVPGPGLPRSPGEAGCITGPRGWGRYFRPDVSKDDKG